MRYQEVYQMIKEAGMNKRALLPLNKVLPQLKNLFQGAKIALGKPFAKIKPLESLSYYALNLPTNDQALKHAFKLQKLLNKYVRPGKFSLQPSYVGKNEGFISNNIKKLLRAIQSNLSFYGNTPGIPSKIDTPTFNAKTRRLIHQPVPKQTTYRDVLGQLKGNIFRRF